MKIRRAWEHFKGKMDALRKRQTEVLRRFSKAADEEQLKKIERKKAFGMRVGGN